MGCGLPEGATGNNIGRAAALRAGCPVSVSGQTVSRYCASGSTRSRSAAKRVIVDDARDRRGRRRRVDQHGAERAESPLLCRRVAAAPRAGPLHADAVHRRLRREKVRRFARAPRRVRAAEPAAHGRRADGGAFRCRDRADAVVEVRARPRNRRRCAKSSSSSARTKGIVPTRRSKGWPRSRAPFPASPIRRSRPATHRSFPTARPPSW